MFQLLLFQWPDGLYLVSIKPGTMDPKTQKLRELGNEGEAAARRYLLEQGYAILYYNLRLGKDEIDIVAEHEGELIIVEVKTRATNSYGVPEDFITPHKEACMIRAAEQYILLHDWKGDTRFDVIAVYWAGRKPVIRHFPNAFYPRA